MSLAIEKTEIRAGRFAVSCRVYGTQEPRIVCVSGAQQSMAVWRSFVSRFVGQYSIVTFDMPGLGHSRALSGTLVTTLDEQVAIVGSVIDATRRPAPLTLAGCSWGAIAAAAYAAQHPSQVAVLVLGSFGVKPSRSMLELIRAGRALYAEGEKAAVARLMIDHFGRHIPEAYKRQVVAQFGKMTEDQALAFYSHSCFIESAGHIVDHVPLGRITARTLIVNGARDTILDLDDMRVAGSLIPNCETCVVEDAGHFLHFERPEVLGVYEEFLSR